MAGAGNPQAMTMAQPKPTAAAQPNVYNQAAATLGQASQTASGAAAYKPVSVGATGVGTSFGYKPMNVAAQDAAAGMAQYQNPYTQGVIDTSMADIERQRMMQGQQIGAQALAAKAFGGSRHGVAEALTNEAFARQGAQMASGLRQQGFQTALGAAQQDVANRMQAALANQSAQAAAQQFGQSSRLAAEQANQQARLQASIANQQAAAQQAQTQLSAASQLGNLANLGFGFGQQITEQQMRQGAQQQAMQQALIDAAKSQYAGFTGAPQASLGLPIQALTGMPSMGSTTSQQPGLLNYLGLAAGLFSDVRLKENVKPAGKLGGVQFYTWDWNEEGKRIANPNQPTFGVMADEVALSHPQHVSRGDDGYLRVHYADLIRELEAA